MSIPASRRERHRSRGIPDATVARLPVYLRALGTLADAGTATVSSDVLADCTGVNSAKVRKDLSHLGSYGTRGVGYDVALLVYQISRELGLTQQWAVGIVGAGNLGQALARYGGFGTRGFRVAAMFDCDPGRIGRDVGGIPVHGMGEMVVVAAAHAIAIGVIATPAEAAQEVCDCLVGAGVRSILNFAPAVLTVPAGVDVRKVDLSMELQILAFHQQRKAGLQALADMSGELAGGVVAGVPARLGAEVPAAPGPDAIPGAGSPPVSETAWEPDGFASARPYAEVRG